MKAPPPPPQYPVAHVAAVAPPAIPQATVVHATAPTGDVVGIAPGGQRLTLAEKMHKMQDELDLPEDIVTDLMSVAGTDIVVIADDSGSMSCVVDPSNHTNPQTRWAELKNTLIKLAHMLLVVDHTDGFHLQFLNDPTWQEIHSKEQLETTFYGRTPRGRTPLGQRMLPILSGAWHPKGHSNETDVILLVMTDGEPSDVTFAQLRTMVQQKRSNVYVTFMMCTEDDDVVDQYNKYIDDIPGVDITDDYASEKREVEAHGRTLNYYKWMAKSVLGGKMFKYDHMDETSRRAGGPGGASQPCCAIA